MFNEQFSVSIRDISYGKHLDHLSLLGYLHETRVRYLKSIGCTEDNIDGVGSTLIVSDLMCNYKKECFYGDIINVKLEIHKISKIRVMFKYFVTHDNKMVATAEITVAFINAAHKLIKTPVNMQQLFAME